MRLSRLTSLFLLVLFVAVIVPRPTGSSSADTSDRFQSNDRLEISIPEPTKSAPAPLMRASFMQVLYAFTTMTAQHMRPLLPRDLTVSLFERNSFYTTVTINAP